MTPEEIEQLKKALKENSWVRTPAEIKIIDQAARLYVDLNDDLLAAYLVGFEKGRDASLAESNNNQQGETK